MDVPKTNIVTNYEILTNLTWKSLKIKGTDPQMQEIDSKVVRNVLYQV